MPITREISQPIGDKSPDVLQWKETLRSPSPTPKMDQKLRSSSRSGLRRSNSFGSLKRSNSNGNLRKSAASFNGSSGKLNKSMELSNIEGEYIKNLQKQIYFLELESNYLREQARKATSMHPIMTSEAERMLSKLRTMQTELDGLHLENQRKESNLDQLGTEKYRLMDRIKIDTSTFAKERRLLTEEIIQLKKDNNALERELSQRDAQIGLQRDELEKNSTAIRASDERVTLLRNQLDQRIEQHKMTQLALEEKRAECLRVEAQLREIEEKYYSSSSALADKATKDLRDEIRMLRQKMKETEMAADQDRYLRTKLTDDSSHLVQENALLNQQVIELTRTIDRERDLRESQETRRSADFTELLSAKDGQKHLQLEMNQMRDELQRERELSKHYREQLAKQEHLSTSTELNASTTRSRLNEIEALHQNAETENTQLRRDKMLLVDHVADLQKQIRDKDDEVLKLRAMCGTVSHRLEDLDHLQTLDNIRQSQKWEEFEKLADTMRSLSHSMALASSPRPAKYAEY
ncbi:uncharacterized protein LOC141909699 isoform X2 [Tubulanus polymorphus]|uniref:uncharacterized protein LOC141909699 isoform X2 n=1 Tax=Tubulanus polymorphus TaxID=672921 RepID=UPI003DA58891